MTPLVRKYAQEAADRHGVTVEAMFASGRTHAVTAARWELWARLSNDGLSRYEIERRTGHSRASIRYALDKMEIAPCVSWPAVEQPPVQSEGLAIVLANIAAMQAKHAREVASRY